MKRLTVSILAAIAVLTVSAQRLNMPILGGELSNSAATSVADIDEVMPRMRALGLNTVLVPAYWELIEPLEQNQTNLSSAERRQKSTEGLLMEPTEGQFDFTLIDRTIDVARREQLHVVFLWFGAWKNSMSCYAPGWFKQDTKRFPRAMTAEGKQMEIASCFSDNVLQADLTESILGTHAPHQGARPTARGGRHDADRERDRYAGVSTRPLSVG